MYEILKEIYGNTLPKTLEEATRFAATSRVRPFQMENGNVPIFLKDIASAMTDGKAIYITNSIFDRDNLFGFDDDCDNHPLTLTTIYNHFLIHESLHIHLNSMGLLDIFKRTLRPFTDVHQILEDLYIESWFRRNYSKLYQIIDDSSNLLNKELDKKNFLTMLASMRNQKFFDLDLFSDVHASILSKIVSEDLSCKMRFDLYMDFYKELERLSEQENEELDKAGESSSTESSKFFDLGKGFSNFPETTFSETADDMIYENLENTNIRNELTNEFENIQRIEDIPETQDTNQIVKWEKEVDFSAYSHEINVDNRWDKLGSYLVQLKIRKQQNIVHSKIGFDIDEEELYRCNLEDNPDIFFSKKSAWDKNKPEIVFLMDFSGSTQNGLNYKIASCCLGIKRSLDRVRIKYAILAHNYKFNEVKIYPFINRGLKNKNKFKNNDFYDKISKVGKISGGKNCDGTAIKEACNLFTRSPSRKILFVASDGLPSVGVGGSYTWSGSSANDWLMKNLENVRERGVSVYSVALEEGLSGNLESLYGKEFCIDASNDIEFNLQQAIRRVING